MAAYPYQSIEHDASISAEYDPAEDQVTVEIVVGEHAETRITMWAEDFQRMAASVKRATDA